MGRIRDAIRPVAKPVFSALALRAPVPVVRRMKQWRAIWNDRGVRAQIAPLAAQTVWENTACPVCGRPDITLHSTKHGFNIQRCRHDGMLFVSPRPTDLAAFYDERYYRGGFKGVYADYDAASDEVAVRQEWESRLNRLESVLRDPGSLLDVGCATGKFLDLALSRGWTGAGVEVSSWACEEVRARLGCPIFEGALPNPAIPSAHYDAVTMWDCIEHVSAPAEALAEIRRVLKTDGVLMLSTGAVPHEDPRLVSGWYYPPWHLYYFSEETIRALLMSQGFFVESYETVHDESVAHRLMVVVARPVR